MKQVPILFFGDSPDLQTGLGRIGRELACLTCELPEFRVGYLGRGGLGSRQLPFVQYNFDERAQWGEWQVEQAWKDFAGSQGGIIFTIWDPSRLLWFSQPNGLPEQMQSFLRSRQFKRWGYFAIDSTGPGDKLTTMSAATIAGYERVLAYTIFGSEVMTRSVGHPVEWIPHGMTDTFTPRDRKPAKMAAHFSPEDVVIGCNMANQARKDWGLAIASFYQISRKSAHAKLWVHTDVEDRYWSLPALIVDFGLRDKVQLTLSGTMSDEQLSYYYSACNITMLPSLGEGFGYPLIESMGCGVPAIHGTYGGGAELLPSDWLVQPIGYRLDSRFNCVRPVFEPAHWAEIILREIEKEYDAQYCVGQVEHLYWKNLWPSAWRKWMLGGVS